MAVRKPLVIISGQVQELPVSDSVAAGSAALNNVISTPTTIPADTSYPVISYLTVNSDLTVNGNLMVIG